MKFLGAFTLSLPILFLAIFSPELHARELTPACVVDQNKIGLVDTADTLSEIEQYQLTVGQCEIYKRYLDKKTGLLRTEFQSDPAALKAQVLCGKWRFFQLGVRSKIGIPEFLLEAIEKYPDAGPRLSNLGFLDDSSWSNRKFPFGVVPIKSGRPVSVKAIASGNLVQISCVACHAGKLPSGQYSVGAANAKMDFGKFNALTLYSIWLVDRKKYDRTRWDDSLIRYYESIDLKEATPDRFKSLKTLEHNILNPLITKVFIGEEPPGLASQRSYLKSKPGIFNGFAPSLHFDDRELYISIPQIWGIGNFSPGHYGTIAGIKSISEFAAEALVFTTQMEKYTKNEYTLPIVEYMKCLEAPKNPTALSLEQVEPGKLIFERNCSSCHNLPDGSGTRGTDFEKMGTPTTFRNIFEDYKPKDSNSRATYKILSAMGLSKGGAKEVRTRRLNGIWTRINLSSNGAIRDLDQLFCLDGSTRENLDTADLQNQMTHLDLCSDYSVDERLALKNFLLTK